MRLFALLDRCCSASALLQMTSIGARGDALHCLTGCCSASALAADDIHLQKLHQSSQMHKLTHLCVQCALLRLEGQTADLQCNTDLHTAIISHCCKHSGRVGRPLCISHRASQVEAHHSLHTCISTYNASRPLWEGIMAPQTCSLDQDTGLFTLLLMISNASQMPLGNIIDGGIREVMIVA